MTENNHRRSNIIWIFGDQHRGQALGYAGDPNVSTPNMDRLAAEGVTFTHAVSGSPLCCPFRGALLSGLYPHHSVRTHEEQLPPELPTIATVFHDAGYHTAYVGKWHLDGFKERDTRATMHIVPPERRGGFAHWIGYENNNSQWDTWVHGGEEDNAFHYRLPDYESNALTDLFIDYLRSRQENKQPFFGVLSLQPPHNPFIAPAEFMGKHTPGTIQLRANVPNIPRIIDRATRDLAGYYAMIENLDWNIGRIRTVLEETDMIHHTHIIFFSDHGDMHGSHGQFRKTVPWEESIRIPCIIGGGETFYSLQRGRSNFPINHVDIAPTTLGLCGIPPPDWMQGYDYSPLRLGTDNLVDAPDSAYLQIIQPTGHDDSVTHPWRGIVTQDGWKYITYERTPWLMYNLNEDLYEQANLAHNPRFSEEQNRLKDRLAAWIHDTDDHFEIGI